jgi:hypothetical protein
MIAGKEAKRSPLYSLFYSVLALAGFEISVPSLSMTPIYDLLITYSLICFVVQVMLSSASTEKQVGTVNKVCLLVTRMNRQSLS